MPYASPVENAIALSQAVLHTDKAREMVANYELSSMDVDVELPDYGNLKKPLLEAFTLDSTACAACTYMWGVAQDAKKLWQTGSMSWNTCTTRLKTSPGSRRWA